MAQEKVLEYQLQAEIPLAFMRYLETRTDERVLEVVLVYNGVDRFDTVIEPTGMKTDPNIVTIDYNHKRVNTGAYLRNVRIEDNYKLEDGTTLEKALVGDIHIPKDSEMFFMDREGQKRSNGNLYEAVTKGQVRSVSVEFRPYKGKQITDTKTGITTYKEWDLLRLSLLDITPGQPYSGIKITRSLINNNNIMLDNIKQALEQGEITKEELRALVEDQNQEVETSQVIETPPVVEEILDNEQEKTEVPNEEERGIEIEVNDNPLAVDEELEPNPDTNQDGDISDEEMRSYYSNLKRIYSDPKMISDKMDEAMRMCGELKKRMDEMTAPKSEEDGVDVETQRERALNLDLDGIPEKKEESEQGSFRQLGEEDKPLDEEALREQELVRAYQKKHYNI